MSDSARHIGIVGVSVEGALLCARIIAAGAERRLPPQLRPQVTLHMHPFSDYGDAMSRGDWAAVRDLLVRSIEQLARGGAELVVIPANAVHIVIDEVSRRASIPVLNMMETVAAECRRRGFRRVAVLGARWTMQSGLYDAPLRRLGIEPVVPADPDQDLIHGIITRELFAGRVREESTAQLLSIVRGLKAGGCQAVVLACTELPLALSEQNCGIAVIDTTRLLAELALDHAQPDGSEAELPG